MLLAFVIAGSSGAQTIEADLSDQLLPGGDEVQYNLTISNTGVGDASGVIFSATIDLNTMLIVGSVRSTPIARDDLFATDEDTAFTENTDGALANDNDPDGDAIIVCVSDTISALGAAVAMLPDGTFTYDPALLFQALAVTECVTDTFNYTIKDASANLYSATVSIKVNGLNDPPTAEDDDFTTNEDTVLNGDVLVDNGNGADSDPDTSDTLSVSEVNGNPGDVGVQIALGSGALLTVNATGTFTYDPKRVCEKPISWPNVGSLG